MRVSQWEALKSDDGLTVRLAWGRPQGAGSSPRRPSGALSSAGACRAWSLQEQLEQRLDSRSLSLLATRVTQWADKKGRQAGSQHRGALGSR